MCFGSSSSVVQSPHPPTIRHGPGPRIAAGLHSHIRRIFHPQPGVDDPARRDQFVEMYGVVVLSVHHYPACLKCCGLVDRSAASPVSALRASSRGSQDAAEGRVNDVSDGAQPHQILTATSSSINETRNQARPRPDAFLDNVLSPPHPHGTVGSLVDQVARHWGTIVRGTARRLAPLVVSALACWIVLAGTLHAQGRDDFARKWSPCLSSLKKAKWITHSPRRWSARNACLAFRARSLHAAACIRPRHCD
jgi:hypothetical protein